MTTPPDPTGLRRLVAAAEAVTSMEGQRRAGYLHVPARVEVPEEDLHKLFYAIGALRVAELERVVEAASRVPKTSMRHELGYYMVNEDVFNKLRDALILIGLAPPIGYSENEVQEDHAALDAPAKEVT